MEPRKVIIMGAAGRDFHNFNTFFRDNESYKVVAFTATQIPGIEERTYPAELAGSLYPDGISIYPEEKLVELIKKYDADEVVFAYSDVPYEYVMSKSAVVMNAGADFRLMGMKETQVKSTKKLVSICAVRTGCGKSQTTRRVSEILKKMGLTCSVIRHPMPYGDLAAQAVQRFATLEDLDKHKCTIEEREEYEPHIMRGNVVFAGVDYERILREAEKESDVVLWDGGNNDMSFYKPDIMITVADPLRPGDEIAYFPGEVNLLNADVVVLNKIDSAYPEDVQEVIDNVNRLNPDATLIEAASPIFVDDPSVIKGKRVLVVEDGPTLTHGEMEFGAGTVAAERFGASEIIDPRPFLKGTLIDTFEKYPDIGELLPAMGYGDQQVKDLEETINATDCDAVIIGTPIDLRKLVNINKPAVRVTYDLQEIGKPTLEDVLEKLK